MSPVRGFSLSQRVELIRNRIHNIATQYYNLTGCAALYSSIHCYADDSQVYISFSSNDRAEQLAVVRNIEDCTRDIRFWMLNNDLKLNDDKTEFLIIGTS